MLRIIWAVDLFDAHKNAMKKAIAVLQELKSKTGATIEAVHILHLNETRLSREIIGPWEEFYAQAAKNALKRILAKVEGSAQNNVDLPVHVIIDKSGIKHVDLFIQYAQQHNADLIVVATHGRLGIRHALMEMGRGSGSFTEALIQKSPIKVLVLGPKISSGIEGFPFETLIFPTDFSKDSKFYYRKAVYLARQLKSRLLLYHILPLPVESILQPGLSPSGETWLPLFGCLNTETGRPIRRAEAWVRWAWNQGVTAAYRIYSEGGALPDVLIGLAAEKEESILVLVDKETKTNAVLHDLTRRVLQQAACPIFVLTPHTLKRTVEMTPTFTKHQEPIPLKKTA